MTFILNIDLCRRYQISQDSLFKVPPQPEELSIIHDFFLNTIDHKAMSFKARVKPDNSVWFEDAKLKNMIVCQPQNRNRYYMSDREIDFHVHTGSTRSSVALS